MAKCTGRRCPMQAGYKVDECNHKDCQYRTEPMTNAEKIRAMNEEKLAAFINRIVVCHHLRNEGHCEKCPIHPAKPCDTEGIMKWLQQPSEVDHAQE